MNKAIVAAVAAMCFFAVPKHNAPKKEQGPVIVEQHSIHPTNCTDGDPLMPVCTMSHLVIENRSYKHVVATLQCGEDEAEIELTPRIRLTVDVEITVFVSDPSCDIKKWEIK